MSIINNASSVKEIVSSHRELMDKIKTISDPFDIDSEIKRGNANINGLSVQGKLQQIANETSKIFALRHLVSRKFGEAHQNGDIHIHDLDYYLTKTATCNQIDLGELLQRGIWNEHGFIRPPRSINTAAYLAAVVLQSHQNQQHGGQSFPSFDFSLAPYVKLSYEKNVKKVMDIMGVMRKDGQDAKVSQKIKKKAWEMTEADTLQAMEGFVHNINTMHSRGGGQVVFASVNFGLDTSREGRLVSKCLMQAQSNGLGKGETPLFPILSFKVKDGVNGLPEDPNYDLFRMSLEVTSKRLFPNWVFLDAPFNLSLYDSERPERAISSMGCRTRLAASVFPESHGTSNKRGNNSFTSINLPRIALEAEKDVDKFFEILDERLGMAYAQLAERFIYQCSAQPDEFRYLSENATLFEDFKASGRIQDALKHNSLSIGFIGLAEALVALVGKHHGESKEAQKLGLRIVGHMRKFCDKKAKEDMLNWSLLATPAEGLSERFVKMDAKRFGRIRGVTDKDYYTNSSHVPVGFDIDIWEKIDIEAPYHALENAGHIAYVEIEDDPSVNIDGLEKIVNYMKKSGVGYGAINHPLDKCLDCGLTGVIKSDTCTKCGGGDIQRLRRITGYLVGDLKRWNNGKRAEERDRVKHDKKG
ncbi:anaerobic ribonucleoside triphosphate reductase [Candidatus Saccharibacteria bacterium]|nr:anaerobic ribonucleoside triphosphate reductase [Candidatus Saccharibacteria bacterium]